jgi:hypothetical protein
MSSHFTGWTEDGTWVCKKHLPVVYIPASNGTCPFVTCDSVRPRKETFSTIAKAAPAKPKPTITPDPTPAPKKVTPTKSAPEPVDTTDEQVSSEESNELCAWFKCNKGPDGKHAMARAKSKYCSRGCSNSSARQAYRMKNQ